MAEPTMAEILERLERLEHLAALEAGRSAGKPAYHVPGPYEIALTVGAALCSTGKFDTPGAALAQAWASIPEFYIGRDAYLTSIAPVVFPAPQQGNDDAA
jgi:hypothetical protein